VDGRSDWDLADWAENVTPSGTIQIFLSALLKRDLIAIDFLEAGIVLDSRKREIPGQSKYGKSASVDMVQETIADVPWLTAYVYSRP
jgi:hypothetical protein